MFVKVKKILVVRYLFQMVAEHNLHRLKHIEHNLHRLKHIDSTLFLPAAKPRRPISRLSSPSTPPNHHFFCKITISYLFIGCTRGAWVTDVNLHHLVASFGYSDRFFDTFLSQFGFFLIFVSFLTVLCDISDFCHNFVRFVMIFATYMLHF